MVTSGTTSFNPDILELVEEAYELVGVEMRSGYSLKTARRSLDLLMREWGNRGLNLWTITILSVVPVEGQPILLPASVIDVLDASWRTPVAGGTPTDTMLTRVSHSQFANIHDKGMRGAPSQYLIRRTLTPEVRLWPLPLEDDPGSFWYYGIRSIEDSGRYTNTMDVPPRFLPALVHGLAYQIGMKTPAAAERVPKLQEEYERQWGLAAEEDRDRASLFITPDLSSYNR